MSDTSPSSGTAVDCEQIATTEEAGLKVDAPQPPPLKSGWSQIVKAEAKPKSAPASEVSAEGAQSPDESVKQDSVAQLSEQTADSSASSDTHHANKADDTVSAEQELAEANTAASTDASEKNEEESDSGVAKSSKPVWRKPVPEVVEPSIPLSDAGISWPSLGDAKQPSKKKGLMSDVLKGSTAHGDSSKDKEGSSSSGSGKKKGTRMHVSALQEGDAASPGASSSGGGGTRSAAQDAKSGGRGRGRSGSREGRGPRSFTEQNGSGSTPSGQVPWSQGSQGPSPGRGRSGGRGRGTAYQRGSSPTMGMQAVPSNGYSGVQMYPPTMYNTFYPPAAYGFANTVASPNPTSNRTQIMASVRKQIDYYFSVENLCKDIFLRSKMDASGWIPLAVIANFNRVRMLTPDITLIVDALRESPVVDVSKDGTMVRARNTWEQWILPPNQQDLAHNPAVMKAEPGPAPSLAAAKPSDAASNTARPAQDGPGDADAKSEKDDADEDDMFAMDEDHQAEELSKTPDTRMSDKDLEKLIVVTQTKAKRGMTDPSMAKMIDDGLALYEQELGEVARRSHHQSNRPPRAPGGNSKPHFYSSSMSKSGTYVHRHRRGLLGESPPSHSVGWLMGTTPTDRDMLGTSPASSFSGSYKSRHHMLGASPSSGSFGVSAPLPKFQHPSHSLLEENGFKQIKYAKYYKKCIDDRAAKGVGQSEEMNTLFRFWCYFLRDHYNESMYNEFKTAALEDAEHNYQYGMECLFRFYSYGLEKKFNVKLYKEFEDMTLKDYNGGQLYGLEKFWAFHYYSGLPADGELTIHPQLKGLLENEYKTSECFKKENARRRAALEVAGKSVDKSKEATPAKAANS